jgi:NAD(P)-dependent dehydrogenase (short-subunit alcohol dehydrogenase family)
VTSPTNGSSDALVTGASSGIGAATCRRLRADGWRVVGLARRPSVEADLDLEIDVTSLDALVDAFSTLPRLRLLVHGAATVGPVVSFAESDPAEWRRTVEVNLIGTYNVLRAGLGGPLARNGGIAIHLTTGAASHAKPCWSAYSVSKAGAEHLVRSAAVDVAGTGCGVCALDPGITETPMQEEIRGLDFPDRERFVRAHEAGDNRSPEEVADAICELAGREPREVNGRTFRVGAL